MNESQTVQGTILRREMDVDESRTMFRNADRYRAQSILYGEIDDTGYLPTHWEATDIIAWRGIVQ